MSRLCFRLMLAVLIIILASCSSKTPSQSTATAVSSAAATATATQPTATPTSTPTPTPEPVHPDLVRYPYLQMPRPDGMTIVWATRNAGTPSVSYGQSALDKKAEGTSTFYEALKGYYQHEVTLSGLTPGTSYRYQVSLGDTVMAKGENLRFRTAPPPEQKSLTFIAFADSGVTYSSVQLALRDQMLKDSFELAVLAGDVSEEEGSFEQFQATYFDVYKEMISRIPFVPVIGDDEYSTADGQPFLDLFVLPRNGTVGRAERFYSFDYGPVHFVALDTEGIGPTQSAWLDADLTASKAFWKVVYFQRTPFGNGQRHLITGYGATRVRTFFAPILEKHKVSLVLAGNNHVYGRTAPLINATPGEPFATITTVENGGVIYVTTGGGGDPMLDPAYSDIFHAPPGGASLSINQYVKVTINDCSLTLKAIDTAGVVRDEFTINRCG